jgi:hypothetical protein
MARTGLTNFVAWAFAAFFLGYFLFGGTAMALVLGAGALALAWWTRYWPEALGIAAGTAGVLVVYGAFAGPGLLPAMALVAATFFVWRGRISGMIGQPSPPRPNGTSTPRRLTIATLLASFAVFVVDFYLALGFGFSCDADANPGAPGSDRAAWCDAITNHHGYAVVLSIPPAVAFLGGIYAASRGRAREVLTFVVAGFALAIAVHVPDVVL